MEEVVMGYIMEIIKLVVLAVVTVLANEAKKLWNRYVDSDIKRNVARTVVRAVEQIFTDLHGRDKLDEAINRASIILEEDYGIEIGDYELISLLEAAVNEFNGTFHKSEPPDQSAETEYGMTD